MASINDTIWNDTCQEVTAGDLDGIAYTTGDKFLVGVFMRILLCVGIIDNVAFIIVVARLPSMRTPTNCYLVNLAVADLIFLIFAMGEKVWMYSLTMYHDNALVFGHLFGCILFPLLADISYFASLCFVTLVSFERYIAVCRPQSRGLFQKFSFIAGVCVASWILSTVISATLIPGNIDYYYHCFVLPSKEPYNSYELEYARCSERGVYWELYVHLAQTLPFFLSLVVNICLYVMIVRGLNQSIKRLRGHGGKKDEDTRIRDQIARMLILNGVILFVCLAPFEILSILYIFEVSNDIPFIVSASRALSYLNSVVNPIIFTTMSQRYREAFKLTFFPRQCIKADDAMATNGTPLSTTNTYIKMTKTKA